MTKICVLVMALISAVSLSARTFTSADGSKTIEADLINFIPSSGKVVIRYANSIRNVTVDAGAFSAKDQDFFNEFLKEATKRNSLKVSADKKIEKLPENEGGLYIYEKRNESFTVSVSNSGPVEIEDISVKYDIFVQRYDKQGKKFTDVLSGEKSIGKLFGSDSEQFETSPVEITVGCETTSSCPKCKTHAAAVEKERVIGIHVRLHDAKGGFITEYHSSISAKSAAEKQAREASASR